MPATQLKAFLESRQIPYQSIKHQAASTTQRIAAAAHVSGHHLAKTVLINLDGKLSMAVLPASRHLDTEKLRVAAGAASIDLSTEMAFVNRFPDCEAGAMPPFGNLYDMKVFMADCLASDTEITFNAGTHSELVKMDMSDFKKLVNPAIVDFSR